MGPASLNLEYLFLLVYRLFTNEEAARAALQGFKEFWQTFSLVSASVSILLAVGVVYCLIRIWQISRLEIEKYGGLAPSPLLGPVMVKNERWGKIVDLVNSEQPNNWRQAIIEADILLDDLVSRLGYRAETLGEKLKQIEPSDFTTLESAWEAHKVRNDIAHRGSDFILSQREAKRVIDLFEKVFREFEYI